jgi:hypothetical protein
MFIASSIFPIGSGSSLVTAVTNAIRNNIVEVLIVIGFIVGLSIVLGLLDTMGFIGQGKRDNDFFKRHGG